MPVLFVGTAFPDKMGGVMEFKVISFDAEGTVVTTEFSTAIWYEAIPTCYARQKGLSFEDAREAIKQEYNLVGPQRAEWYDVSYWFRQFALPDYRPVLNNYLHLINYYPETQETLASLSRDHHLVISSASSREFLNLLLAGVKDHFKDVFSCISDYRLLKSPEFYITVCRMLQVKPHEVVHVGDNWEGDYLAPRQAGIRAFYLDRNGEKQGEDVVRSLSEFRQRLLA